MKLHIPRVAALFFSGCLIGSVGCALASNAPSVDLNEANKLTSRVLSVNELPTALQKAAPKSLEKYLLSNSVVRNTLFADPRDFNRTDKALDFALLDDGYIVTRTPGPLRTFVVTRFGSLLLDMNGYIDIQDLHVQSLLCPPDGPSIDCDSQVPAPILPPTATTLIQTKLNLNTSAVDSPSYTVHVTPFDSRGDYREINMVFTPISFNDVNVVVTEGESNTTIAHGSLRFDSTGALYQQIGLKQISSRPGLPPFDIDFSGSTNYSRPSQIYSLHMDGFLPGYLINMEVLNDGSMLARYSNWVDVKFAQIHFSTEDQADLTPYLPLYPGNFWTFKENPGFFRSITTGIRVLPGWLEKAAYRMPSR